MSTTDLSKALSLVPEIKAAYEEAEKCQRTSHSRALEYAIKAGGGLRLAKEAVGHGAFSIWRQQNLPHIPPTTATLYMRLAEHKDKFREIGNTVADLSAKGELSLRKAAALLPKRPQTAEQIAAAKATSPHASDGKSADRSAELRTPSQNSKVWASRLYPVVSGYSSSAGGVTVLGVSVILPPTSIQFHFTCQSYSRLYA